MKSKKTSAQKVAAKPVKKAASVRKKVAVKTASVARRKTTVGASSSSSTTTSRSRKNGKPVEGWNLRLYVAGQTPRSLAAFANLKRLCEEHLPGKHHIEVVDLVKQPQLAQRDEIVALPTLVRKLPEPIKRVIGDLSNLEKVMVGMDLQPSN